MIFLNSLGNMTVEVEKPCWIRNECAVTSVNNITDFIYNFGDDFFTEEIYYYAVQLQLLVVFCILICNYCSRIKEIRVERDDFTKVNRTKPVNFNTDVEDLKILCQDGCENIKYVIKKFLIRNGESRRFTISKALGIHNSANPHSQTHKGWVAMYFLSRLVEEGSVEIRKNRGRVYYSYKCN